MVTGAGDAQAAAATTSVSSHPQIDAQNQHEASAVTTDGSETTQLGDACVPTQLIQAGPSSLPAADPLQSSLYDAHTATQLAEEVEATQLVDSGSANCEEAAAPTQLTNADDINDPAHRLASAQSADLHPMTCTPCDHVMTEAAHDCVPAEEADAGTMTQLADDAAAIQLAEGAAATQLANDAAATQLANQAAETQLADGGTAAQLADDAAATQLAGDATATQLVDDAAATQLADGVSKDHLVETVVGVIPATKALPKPTGKDSTTQPGDVVPMQTDVSASDEQEVSRSDHHSQHEHLSAPDRASEKVEPQTRLQDSRAAEAGRSTQAQSVGKAGLAVEQHAMDIDPCVWRDTEMEKSARPPEPSATQPLPGAPGQQDIHCRGKDDQAAHKPAQTDAEMEPATHGDHMAVDHSMPEGQLAGRSPEPSKQTIVGSQPQSEGRTEAAAGTKGGLKLQSEPSKAASPGRQVAKPLQHGLSSVFSFASSAMVADQLCDMDKLQSVQSCFDMSIGMLPERASFIMLP